VPAMMGLLLSSHHSVAENHSRALGRIVTHSRDLSPIHQVPSPVCDTGSLAAGRLAAAVTCMISGQGHVEAARPAVIRSVERWVSWLRVARPG
jgi:hypothetical protein